MAIDRAEPGPGQESVWDYPRPPRREPTTRHIVVALAGAAVVGNEGTFYGGWITSDVVGPFKGGAGSAHW